MKLTIPANELSTAVKEYLQRTYSLYGEVTVEELHEVEVDIYPRSIENLYNPSVVKEQVEGDLVERDREDAINRADHLGIKYRSDISTDKLIERIEEHELDMINKPYSVSDGNELPLEDVVDTVVESDEPVEEVVSDETIEAEEVQPEKKKKSIFAKD